MKFVDTHQRPRNSWIGWICDKSLVVVDHLRREDPKNYKSKDISSERCSKCVIQSNALNIQGASTDAWSRRSITR